MEARRGGDKRMIPKEIAPYRNQLLVLARQHGLSSVRVVGSFARGEARPESDMDFLVTVEPGRSLLDLLAFEMDAERLLHRRVEAHSEKGLSNRFRETLLHDAVPL